MPRSMLRIAGFAQHGLRSMARVGPRSVLPIWISVAVSKISSSVPKPPGSTASLPNRRSEAAERSSTTPSGIRSRYRGRAAPWRRRRSTGCGWVVVPLVALARTLLVVRETVLKFEEGSPNASASQGDQSPVMSSRWISGPGESTGWAEATSCQAPARERVPTAAPPPASVCCASKRYRSPHRASRVSASHLEEHVL